MLFFGSLQVIAVILAVFLHHANGRTITSTSNDNIEGMLDLAEEELNTVLNEANENPTERENLADVITLSEPDSSSLEAIQSHFSSDNMIQPREASPVLRQKRYLVGPCYTGDYQTVRLVSGGLAAFPICMKVSVTGCGSAITKYGMRKCKESDYKTVSFSLNGAIQTKAFPKKCSCAV